VPARDRDGDPAERRRRAQARIDPDLLDRHAAGLPPDRRPAILAAVALGAVAGTGLRYWVTRAMAGAPGSFPWPTLVVNISGSFLLGVLMALVVGRWPPRRYLRPFVGIGFLGAYTTFSTLVVEADLLVMDHAADVAATYVAVSLIGGLVAAFAGAAVTRRRPAVAGR
jgi:CrcB protein